MSFAGVSLIGITTQAVAVMPDMKTADPVIDTSLLARSIDDSADMLFGNGQITEEEFNAVKTMIEPFVPR